MTASDLIWLETKEALALARAGVNLAEWSPLGEQKALLVNHSTVLPEHESALLTNWLCGMTCPVIALVEPDGDDLVGNAVDVRLQQESEAAALVDSINANPIAATTFVQLLRITENMPIYDALHVESLAYATLQAGSEYASWLEKHQFPAPFQPNDEGPAVLVERDGSAVSLMLNRASNRNAMSVEMRDALNEALEAVLADRDVQSLHISGKGKCFSQGGDLTEFGMVPDPASGHIIRSLTVPGRALARCADRFGDKVVVHVHGSCVGSGIEFPAFAGCITASEDAWFQLPEVGMGLIPGAGGCISIARRIGRQRSAYLGLAGNRLSAIQASEWGLVDQFN